MEPTTESELLDVSDLPLDTVLALPDDVLGTALRRLSRFTVRDEDDEDDAAGDDFLVSAFGSAT